MWHESHEIDLLRRRFRLTPAEAKVALQLTKGDGRLAVANRLGITLATVSTHLRHIFAKTGTHRQAELVGLLLRARKRVVKPVPAWPA
ncbi:helix-turn-helix transcriptional regulator [Reyranella sp. CPCC 100927]|nr:helix-turn-helix transcriptional regulator [Reyranella sp. CPCC 100927]